MYSLYVVLWLFAVLLLFIARVIFLRLQGNTKMPSSPASLPLDDAFNSASATGPQLQVEVEEKDADTPDSLETMERGHWLDKLRTGSGTRRVSVTRRPSASRVRKPVPGHIRPPPRSFHVGSARPGATAVTAARDVFGFPGAVNSDEDTAPEYKPALPRRRPSTPGAENLMTSDEEKAPVTRKPAF